MSTPRPTAPWVTAPDPAAQDPNGHPDTDAGDAGLGLLGVEDTGPVERVADPLPPRAESTPTPVAPAAPRGPLRVARTRPEPPPPLPVQQAPWETAGPAPEWGSQLDTTAPVRRGGPVPAASYRPAPPAPAPTPPGPPVRHGGELGRDMLFKPIKRTPERGWRRFIHTLTGGSVNPGESADDVRRRHLVERVNQTIRGDFKIGVLALKGGVGKTTITVGLGSTYAPLRGDHVVAIDANPDRGTLGDRIPRQTSATVRDLLDDAENIGRYSDVRAFTSQAPSRLEVLASEQDPEKAEAFSRTDYRRTVGVLEQFYNLILSDCGTGLTHSAMAGVLETADALVLVTSPALDGAQSADATLNWLDAQGYGHLVDRTVAVISATRPGSTSIDLNQLVEHFESRVRAVKMIPYDVHLAEGSEVDLDRLKPETRDAFVELAALVADDFPEAAGRHHGPGPVRR